VSTFEVDEHLKDRCFLPPPTEIDFVALRLIERDTCASDGGKLGRGSRMDLAAWTPRALSILRIVTGLLFLEHGTGKLLGFPPSDHTAPTPFSLIGVQGVLELVGGFLILIGLFTRPVAFIFAGDMAVAYFMAHAPKSVFPPINGGQLAILFCFVFLYLVFAGGGVWSADEQLARSRAR
jgi:putative oxidoreductase